MQVEKWFVGFLGNLHWIYNGENQMIVLYSTSSNSCKWPLVGTLQIMFIAYETTFVSIVLRDICYSRGPDIKREWHLPTGPKQKKNPNWNH